MNENIYQRWFVTDYYVAAGRPKMESLLFDYARKEWLYCTVYETFIPAMVKDLKEQQEIFWRENKRLKKVRLETSPIRKGDDLIFLYIGELHLTLRKVREEIEYMK